MLKGSGKKFEIVRISRQRMFEIARVDCIDGELNADFYEKRVINVFEKLGCNIIPRRI